LSQVDPLTRGSPLGALAEGHPACKKLSGGMLGQGADLHMAQLMPLPLIMSCSSKSRLVLASWFYLSGAGSPG